MALELSLVEQVVALLVEQVAEPQVADMLIVLMVVEQLAVDMRVVAPLVVEQLAVDIRVVAPLVDPSVAFQQQVFGPPC